MGMRQRRKHVNWFRFGMLALIGYFLYVCIGQQYQLYVINRETDQTRRQLDQAVQLRQDLTQEKERLYDLAYIEKLAREEFGLVKAGEVPFIPAVPAAQKK